MDIQQIFAARQQAEQNRRLECYRRLNRVAKKGQIVFAGSSLMEQFPIDEMQHSLDLPWCIYNRGIGGYVSSQMLQGLEAMVLELEPAKLFINIGTNDIGLDIQDQLWPNYKEILRRVKDRLPGCRVYLMAYYPCNNQDDFGLPDIVKAGMFRTRTTESLLEANRKVEQLAREMGCRYIDVNRGLADGQGLLRAEYAVDGVHFYPDGYFHVLENLRPWLAE